MICRRVRKFGGLKDQEQCGLSMEIETPNSFIKKLLNGRLVIGWIVYGMIVERKLPMKKI
jgi:hypothetical protein